MQFVRVIIESTYKKEYTLNNDFRERRLMSENVDLLIQQMLKKKIK